ncbi:MAG TPA: hypothetical protein VGN04_18000 [Herbaspirillum sp.]|jgi:hypothetical protein
MMTKMSKIPLLPGALLLSALLATACSTTPDAPAPDDQLVFQACLRGQPMLGTRQLDFTFVRPDRRDIEPSMLVGTTTAQQPIFESVEGNYAGIKSTLLSVDRKVWYVFDLPQDAQAARLGTWSDWRPVGYASSSEDVAYKLQHDLAVDKDAADHARDAVKVRFTMMHYKDVLATRAMRRLELPKADFEPC